MVDASWYMPNENRDTLKEYKVQFNLCRLLTTKLLVFLNELRLSFMPFLKL